MCACDALVSAVSAAAAAVSSASASSAAPRLIPPQVCAHLLSHGCNRDLRNRSGHTARDIAEFNGRNKFQVRRAKLCAFAQVAGGASRALLQVEKANFDAVVKLLGPNAKL